MYMEANFVEEILKCSFCRDKFTTVVKLIPECGSSICGTCHKKILEQLFKGSNDYLCQECNVTHAIPAAGLSDNKALVKLIMLKNEPKTDKIDMFNKFKEEIAVKIEKMKSTDAEAQVGDHCDLLVKQVMAEIEAAFNHLNKVGNTLLEKINEYRGSLLEPKAPPAKRLKTSVELGNGHSNSHSNSNGDHDQEEDVKQEFARLLDEIEEYGKTLALVGSGMSQDHSIDLLETRIKRYQSRYERLEIKLREEFFKGRLMRFKPNPAFCSPENLLGELVFDESEEDQSGVKHEPESKLQSKPVEALVDEEPDCEALASDEYELVVKPEDTYEPPRRREFPKEPQLFYDRGGINIRAHRLCVRQVLVLSDGNIASCSDDRMIKIWAPAGEKKLFEFEDNASVFSIVELSHDLLASGSRNKFISIWDLKKRQLARTLKGHNLGMLALLLLPNGNLVSGSWDDSIKVWDPYSNDYNLLATMHEHGARFTNNFSITPDGYILACSTNKTYKSKPRTYGSINIIKMWNATGELLRSFSTGATDASSILGLRDGRIAVGFLSGRLAIFDLDHLEDPSFEMKKCHYSAVLTLAETSKGYLLTGGSSRDSRVKVWNMRNWSLVQVINTGHVHNICAISLSKDEKFFATCSYDLKIKTFY